MKLKDALILFNDAVNVQITDIYGNVIHEVTPLKDLIDDVTKFNSEDNVESFMNCKVTKIIPHEIKQFEFKYFDLSLNVVAGDKERVVF